MATLHVTATETIRAPIERVWESISDTSRYAEWVEGTLAVTRTDGPARLGGTYDEINRVVGPIRSSSRWKVIEFEPLRRQVHRDESIPFTRSLDLVFEVMPAEPSQTTLSLTLARESRLGPIGALIVRLLAPSRERQNRRNVARFRALVEREVGA